MISRARGRRVVTILSRAVRGGVGVGEFVAAATGRDGDDGARDDDDACDVVGEIPQGVVAFAWCPDGEVCAALTRDARVLVMTKDFYPLFESLVTHDDDDDDETTTLANGSISWRGDGRYFACSSTHARTNETTIKVWERERVVVESACETRTATSGTPATPRAREGEGRRRSRGNLVGRSSRPRDKSRAKIAIAWCFTSEMDCEEASLRFREGTSARRLRVWRGARIPRVSPSPCGTAGKTATARCRLDAVEHALVHETRDEIRRERGRGQAVAERDAERGDVLRTYTEKGTVERFDLFWETTTSDRGTCAVIDGDVVMLTPMFRTPMPPPLCAAKAVFSARRRRGRFNRRTPIAANASSRCARRAR